MHICINILCILLIPIIYRFCVCDFMFKTTKLVPTAFLLSLLNMSRKAKYLGCPVHMFPNELGQGDVPHSRTASYTVQMYVFVIYSMVCFSHFMLYVGSFKQMAPSIVLKGCVVFLNTRL